jgi:ammonia channel protein AmtB
MNAGDTAWVLVSTALVMVMLPGLAFFYGGLVSSRNVLVMLQQNIFPLGLVSVLWVLAGFSLAFGPDAGGGMIGNLAAFGLRDLAQGPSAGMRAVVPGLAIPGLAFVAYMMMFAIITPALITGATADRLKFAGYAVVLGLWSLIVYAPVAHWLFSPSGWLARRGRRTGRAALWSTRRPARPCSPCSWSSGGGDGGRTRPPDRTRFRWPCWAPACCGSAGSASTGLTGCGRTALPHRP